MCIKKNPYKLKQCNNNGCSQNFLLWRSRSNTERLIIYPFSVFKTVNVVVIIIVRGYVKDLSTKQKQIETDQKQ